MCWVDKRASAVAARLIELARARAVGLAVRELRIGLIYTGVQLSDGSTGVALTPLGDRRAGDERCAFADPEPFAGRPALALVTELLAHRPIAAAAGLACANALFNRPSDAYENGDVLRKLPLRPTDRVAMIGHFRPLEERLRGQVADLQIFEQNPSPEAQVRPAEEALAMLPRCEVALITSSTIANGTVDDLLAAATSCREVVLLGASTPLVPDAFAHSPVTRLSGVVIRDARAVLCAISEGGGMRIFKRFVQKVDRTTPCLPKPNALT